MNAKQALKKARLNEYLNAVKQIELAVANGNTVVTLTDTKLHEDTTNKLTKDGFKVTYVEKEAILGHIFPQYTYISWHGDKQ